MLRKITYFVLGGHLLLVFSLLFSPVKKIPAPTKHVVVRTSNYRQPVAVAHTGGQRSSGGANRPSRPVAAAAKKPAKKKTEGQKPAQTAKQAPTKSKKPAVSEPSKKKKAPAAPAIPQDLLDELEEFTTKIDSKKGKSYPSSKLDVPAPLGKVGIGFADVIEIGGYEDSLISYLHQSLNLPDYGEVKIQLSLREDGTVTKMVVLKAESQKNKEYLEKNLPSLKFPRLTSKLKEETFILTFCNEI